MGLSHISPGSLLLILIIVVLLFGTGRLRNIGKDLGEMTKSFKEGLSDANQVKSEVEMTLNQKNPENPGKQPNDQSNHKD